MDRPCGCMSGRSGVAPLDECCPQAEASAEGAYGPIVIHVGTEHPNRAPLTRRHAPSSINPRQRTPSRQRTIPAPRPSRACGGGGFVGGAGFATSPFVASAEASPQRTRLRSTRGAMSRGRLPRVGTPLHSCGGSLVRAGCPFSLARLYCGPRQPLGLGFDFSLCLLRANALRRRPTEDLEHERAPGRG